MLAASRALLCREAAPLQRAALLAARHRLAAAGVPVALQVRRRGKVRGMGSDRSGGGEVLVVVVVCVGGIVASACSLDYPPSW